MASTSNFSFLLLLTFIILNLSSSSADEALITQVCKTSESDQVDMCVRWLKSNPTTMACPDKPCLVDSTMKVAVNQVVAASNKAKQLLTNNPKPSDVGPLDACISNYKLVTLLLTETSVAVKDGFYGEAVEAIVVATGLAAECEMWFTEQPSPLADVVKPLNETMQVGFVIVDSYVNTTNEIWGMAGLPRRLGK